MKQPEKELKLSNLNFSMQSSQKLFNPQLLLTDYSIYNENDDINNEFKTIKIEKINKDKKRHKIMVNSNASKNYHNISIKNIVPNLSKTPGIYRTNNSKDKINDIKYNKINKKRLIQNERNLGISHNNKLLACSTNNKEIKDFKLKLKKKKKTDSKDIISTKNQNDKMNRNLNLTLTNFSSLAGTEYIIDNKNKSIEQNEQSVVNHINDEIIIQKRYANIAKNIMGKKIINDMNLKDVNYNFNFNNSIINNNSTLSNKNSTNTSTQFHRRKHQKINLSSSSSQFHGNSIKQSHKISNEKKLDILKNNMNEQINDINNNYNKIKNISDIDVIKKNELVFDIIQNSFFKFTSLLKEQKEKEVALEIIQKLNEFLKKQDSLMDNIIKKYDDINEKIKDYKEKEKFYKKENMLLVDKIDNLQKIIEEMEKEIKNNEFKMKERRINLFENGYKDESINIDKENENDNDNNNNSNKSEDESSVNSEELESIRFFDKIIMKKHSFSKANIPELEIKQIKLINNEIENKQKVKLNFNKIKNDKIFRNRNKLNKCKETHNGLGKKENKSSKVIEYKKIVDNKKKKIKK